MILYGLRLLVALLTFAVGVAASLLFGSGHSIQTSRRQPCGKRAYANEQVLVFKAQEQTPAVRPMTGHFFFAEGNINGRAVSLPQPTYPARAKSAQVRGTVEVLVSVDEDGKVVSAHASSGPESLRGAAEEAALRATFPPGLPGRGALSYRFGLE